MRGAHGGSLVVCLGALAACSPPALSEASGSSMSSVSDPGDDPAPPQGGEAPTPLPACAAQRTVHVVAGNGGLAWFTLLWPAREVVTANDPSYAYDDVSRAPQAPGSSDEHPHFARSVGDHVLWQGVGSSPMPTVFVAGANQTHTSTPRTTFLPSGTDVIAAGAAAQSSLHPQIPVLRLGLQAPYGPADGVPRRSARRVLDVSSDGDRRRPRSRPRRVLRGARERHGAELRRRPEHGGPSLLRRLRRRAVDRRRAGRAPLRVTRGNASSVGATDANEFSGTIAR